MTGRRGRPKKTNGSAPTADGEVSTKHNRKPKVAVEPLTDDQEHALTAHHASAYGKLLAAKKTADANLKNGVKLAKAEGIGLAAIKEYIDFQTPDGRERLEEEIARKHKIARWAGLPVGTQLNFFEDDRAPLEYEVFNDGKRAGLKGDRCDPPHHLPGALAQQWQEGWHEGQAVLATKFSPLATEEVGDEIGDAAE
jgi:hypothetical protein